MQSKKRVEPLDTFEQDVPVTPEDSKMLWSLRDRHNTMSPEEYLQFLLTFTANLPASRETNSESDEPFVL